MLRNFAGFACVLACANSLAQNSAEVLQLERVQIIGTTPLPGSGVAASKIPANVQVYSGRDVLRQRNGNLTEFLEQNVTGLSVNAAQGNPYQPDINVRGFTASPLLGTPQGLSVFLDGMRINEPFGDAVNWDLIPQSAIASIQVIPGSNPAFGLNTLGGAIALYTKSGAREYPGGPGGSITISGGSFGRRTLAFETGGQSGQWDWFLTGNNAIERGWAQHNSSRVRQLFAKFGWHDNDTDLDLTLSGANNVLQGTQTIPLSFDDPRQAYTYPDENRNQAGLVSVKASRALSAELVLSGNAYVRQYTSHSLSSNVNPGFSAADPVQATNDRQLIDQRSDGFGLQLGHNGVLLGWPNKLSLGASIDQGRTHFTHTAQDATFAPDRGSVGISSEAAVTDANSTTRYLGAYLSDSLDLAQSWTLTLAGRFNRADVSIADRSGAAPDLNGSHHFTRFNPAVGLNFNPGGALTIYASYNEGMRAPTAIELSCADPNAPCQLPNSFISDPALKPVISRTIELGARGQIERDTTWSAAVFRTDLRDDLQFVSSNGVSVNAGYFQNVGATRRQGIEVGGSTRVGPVALTLHYSFIDATYQAAFAENSPNNSSADTNGAIAVRSGDRISSVPRHSFKLRAETNPAPGWSVAANLLIAGSVYARGDENNVDRYGRVPGFGALNVDSRYQVNSGLQVFARVNNLFDRRYANFGTLGDNLFTGPSQSFDPTNPRAEQFRGYAAPRGAWIGLQYSLR